MKDTSKPSTYWDDPQKVVHVLYNLLRVMHMVGHQKYGPLLGPSNTRCRNILRTQKGTISLTTTHILLNLVLRSAPTLSGSQFVDKTHLDDWGT